MNTIKRLTVWMMGIAFIPVTIILVWLFTFMSFDLLPVLRDSLTLNGTIVVSLVWGFSSLVLMGMDDINDILS